MIEVLYTDTDQIRGALQITEEDLGDERFNQGILELDLTLDLDAWAPTHATIYATGLGTPTASQLNQFNLLRAYSAYFCAYQTLQTGALSMPQNISDGKNTIERPQDRAGLRDFIAGRLATYKSRLTELLTGSVPSYVGQFLGVGSNYDPVTG